jgi:hypothetical protein
MRASFSRSKFRHEIPAANSAHIRHDRDGIAPRALTFRKPSPELASNLGAVLSASRCLCPQRYSVPSCEALQTRRRE